MCSFELLIDQDEVGGGLVALVVCRGSIDREVYGRA